MKEKNFRKKMRDAPLAARVREAAPRCGSGNPGARVDAFLTAARRVLKLRHAVWVTLFATRDGRLCPPKIGRSYNDVKFLFTVSQLFWLVLIIKRCSKTSGEKLEKLRGLIIYLEIKWDDRKRNAHLHRIFRMLFIIGQMDKRIGQIDNGKELRW